MNNDISIVGAGAYGEVMKELADILGYNVIAFYDDRYKEIGHVNGVKVKGSFEKLPHKDIYGQKFIVAIGSNHIRFQIMKKINNMNGKLPFLIHPSAFISPSASIGKGVYIHAKSYIWSHVKIDDYCLISPGVVVAHHSTIGKACLISTNSSIGASIHLDNEVFAGMSSTVVTGVKKIGEKVVIGAGAVVLEDVPKRKTVVGIPAKPI